ncbi:AtzH-like domain-containing protein [Nocardioides sp. ChNu-99]|uniref:AtzH-like domain-containing protein n=1 Tax=Nocardioides sp. ChNu-99 TaxID=2839897 RepID=UPI002404E106|nr:AtzH-like domain-containing protein [Nocardioides sp. ChNu-99]MDF9716814.1 DUF3225 domain-containing protein [Nocardioides sp. ChNu-99]
MSGTANAPDDLPPGLVEAFWAYERALMADDLATLDALFAPGPDTLRADAAGVLVGHEQISAFRGGRGGAPRRTVVDVRVQVVDDANALVMATTELARGGRGVQTQLWQRREQGWVVTAAHVATTPPALDTRIWRVVGDPLVTGRGEGPLAGETVAVKDVYAIAGQKVGAGSPAYLAAAPPAPRTARAVQRLLDAGAVVTGIARTDEFAWSLFGTNEHHGTPPNPHAPHRIPGGSSSGSATATSLGQVSIGLGTDTGGSIRVPASWQGLWGIRTSRNAVPRDGLLALAPTFDTVGWMTRDAGLLTRVGDVLLPPAPPPTVSDLVLATDLLALAAPDVRASVEAVTRSWGTVFREPFGAHELTDWRRTFVLVQSAEAWRQHAGWVASRLSTLSTPVRERFEAAARLDPAEVTAAADALTGIRLEIRHRIGDRVLLLPSTPTVAPYPGTADQQLRDTLLALTSIAGIGGLPAVNVPLRTAEGLPCGVCLVAAPGRDRDLLALAADLARSRDGV